MRERSICVVVGLLAVVLAGCAELLDPQPQITGGLNTPTIDQAQAVPYNGPRARIAVLDFEQKAAQGYAHIGSGMSDMLATELLNTNRFIVLERQKLAGVLAEQDLARTGRIQPGTGAPTGQVEGAELLITGAITEFDPDYQGGGIGFGGGHFHRRHGGIGGVGLGLKQAYVALDLRVIDTRTSRIVAATTVTGRASDVALGVGGLGYGRHSIMGGGLGVFRNTPMEKAVRQCLAAAVAFVVARTPANYYHYNEAGQPIQAGMAGVPTIVAPAQPVGPTPGQPPAIVVPAQPTPAQPTPPQPSQPQPIAQQPTPPQPPQPGALPAQVYAAFATVNLYEKPDANSPMVGSAAKGTLLRVQGQDGSWYNVTTPDNKTGWVLKAFTVSTPPQP